ncbi:GNAT family N-acetyltransferase [Streptomyces sp. NPDC002574]|uniref:GNAT family N-acetyltransferase n=1 Tax=Streptomyces sp. NPDC002574 TaxID=3364652 RepID=UPI00368817C1
MRPSPRPSSPRTPSGAGVRGGTSGSWRGPGRSCSRSGTVTPLALCWLRLSPTRPGPGEIFSFYCHPDGWGGGIAHALMAQSLRRLRDDGLPRVHLRTLRDTPQSRRFYVKCGFTESGSTRTYDYGDGNPVDQVEYERAC